MAVRRSWRAAMSRFNTPAECRALAEAGADGQVHRALFWGHCMNPYSTPGRRNDFWRGFKGLPADTYGGPITGDYDLAYQRGAACARYLATLNNAAKTTPTP